MSHNESAKAPYEVLIRSVAQGIREVYASGQWGEVSPKAEALWMLYAGSTGLSWAEVEARVRKAWEASTPGMG
jgi:hypothetical protein